MNRVIRGIRTRNFEVLVGNIGTVYDGLDEKEALETYREYVLQSRNGYGRAANEPVTLMVDGEISRGYEPPAGMEQWR